MWNILVEGRVQRWKRGRMRAATSSCDMRADGHVVWVGTILSVLASPTAAGHHVEDFDAEVPWGCASRDCIPSIDEPRFDDGQWLEDDDRVLGIEIGGDARAYPVRILNWHEIVNDVVGGTPVAVTYCPLCGTGLTFERTLRGEVTTFGVSGRLYRNDLVMYDRATESYWSQAIGESIWGERHGDRLRFVPTATASWSEWRDAHPGTRVLARPDAYPASRYDQYPYGDYESDPETLFPVDRSLNALHPKAWVLGVFTGNASVAYKRDDIREEGVIRDRLDGRELVVSWTDGAPQARWADGNGTPDQVFGFWFAWYDFHPETRLWGHLVARIVHATEHGGVTRVEFSQPVDPDAIAPHIPPGVNATWLDDHVLELSGSGSFVLPPGNYATSGAPLLGPLVISLDEATDRRETPGLGAAAVVLGALASLGWLALRRRRVR
jgi:hypothetical protein